MHSRDKGRAGSKRPVRKTAPSWIRYKSDEVELLISKLSKEGYTHKLIHQSKEFVIAVPNKKLQKAVEFFGSTSGNKVDKFKETKIKTLKSRYLKSPLIKDATINLECKLKKEIDLGDHTMFIGEIIAAYTNPKKKRILLNMGKIKGKRVFKEF